MRALQHRRGRREKLAPRGREIQAASASVRRVHRHFDQTAALERLQIRGQRRAVHREQARDAPHRRSLGPVERGQKRELAAGQSERPEHVIKAASQRARSPLHMQAKAAVPHMQREFKWRRALSACPPLADSL